MYVESFACSNKGPNFRKRRFDTCHTMSLDTATSLDTLDPTYSNYFEKWNEIPIFFEREDMDIFQGEDRYNKSETNPLELRFKSFRRSTSGVSQKDFDKYDVEYYFEGEGLQVKSDYEEFKEVLQKRENKPIMWHRVKK